MAIRKLDVDAIADNTLTGDKIEGFTSTSLNAGGFSQNI